MNIALWLLAALVLIGLFDTLYYHEWKARLPAGGKVAAPELKIHAARDFFYAVIFLTLPILEWHGAWALVFVAVLVIEIVLTMWDFVIEMVVRKPLGDVYAGERVTHNFMGIIYGAMIAFLIPEIWGWWQQPTAFVSASHDAPQLLVMFLLASGVGVFLSGARDLYAAFELPGGSWPWPKDEQAN